jgi:cytochrome c551
MANYKGVAAALLGAALISIGAGCGGSDPKEAETPANAPTVTNGATTTGGGGTETPSGGGEAAGDAAAGKTYFEGGTCQGCHPAGGTQAGVGPDLTASKMTADEIKTQIEKGGGGMPAQAEVTGADLDNVVAYILSIRK